MTLGNFLELADIISAPVIIYGAGEFSDVNVYGADILLYEADSYVRDDLRIIPDDVLRNTITGFDLDENGNFIIYTE